MTDKHRQRQKYSYYWRWIPVIMIQRYPRLKSDNSLQARIFTYAIERAIKETNKLPEGELRLKAVNMVYIAKTHLIDGAAAECFASRSTVKRWLRAFCELVALYSGYVDEDELLSKK